MTRVGRPPGKVPSSRWVNGEEHLLRAGIDYPDGGERQLQGKFYAACRRAGKKPRTESCDEGMRVQAYSPNGAVHVSDESLVAMAAAALSEFRNSEYAAHVRFFDEAIEAGANAGRLAQDAPVWQTALVQSRLGAK